MVSEHYEMLKMVAKHSALSNFFLKLHHRHLKADRDKSTVKLKYVGNPFYMGFKTCLSVGCPWGQCLNLPPVLLSILTYLLAKHDIPLFL